MKSDTGGTSRSGGAVHATLSFDPSDVRTSETPFGTVIELADGNPSGEPGGPGLPSMVVRLALPAFSVVRGVSAKAKKAIALADGPVLIAPIQLPQPGRDSGKRRSGKDAPEDTSGARGEIEDGQIRSASLRQPDDRFVEPFPARPIEPPRPELYEAEAKDPRPIARHVATELAGPVPIAVIEVSPVRLTKRGGLEMALEIELIVEYEAGAPEEQAPSPDADRVVGDVEALEDQPRTITRAIHSRAQASRLVELTRAQVLNPADVLDFSPWFPVLFLQVDHLIVTSNQAWNPTTLSPAGPVGDLVSAFQRLADWKAKRGVRSRVVTIDDIVAGRYGGFTAGARDLQEVIRSFLRWAYEAWGMSWVVLGGDIGIVPMRRAAGASEGHIGVDTTNPPADNRSFWTGTYLRMHVVNPGTWWPGSSADHFLVRADDGRRIPYDPAGTSGPSQAGWYFTTTNSYATRSTAPTQFVRVNGPASLVNATLQWLYEWNQLPTDLYYSSLIGPNYGLPGRHDWDLLDNGIYGQHTDGADIDGVEYQADVSVGRAPVASLAEADAFVTKVIAYEQFRRPDGSGLDLSWPSRMLLVSSNWGGRIGIFQTSTNPPENNRYYHATGAAQTLIHLESVPTDLQWQLIAQVSAPDVRLLPYDRSPAPPRGWRYVVSDTNLAPSEISFSIFGIPFHFPVPTAWVAVFGAAAELAPQAFIFDRDEADGSLHDQEQLRAQIDTDLPGITNFNRLYEDEVDLTPAEAAVAPFAHLTEDRLRDALNAAPHFVSLSGHGNSNGCCFLSASMAQNLHNGYQSFIGYGDSCLTNQFDADDAMSEELLQNPNGGGVAYVGNSRFSWIGVGDNFQRAFFRRLMTTRHIGLANDTRVGMVNESTGFYRLYNKWAIFTLNLMGDPEMPVWTARPRTMTVSFPGVVDKRLPFTVSVRRPFLFLDLPLAGAFVHIKRGSFVRTATTNGLGLATFDLNPASLGALEVTVTAVDYLPFIGTARIAGPAWVRGKVRQIIHQDGTPHQTLVRLHLDPAIDGDLDRGWYARDSRSDYGIILDAATDAYVDDKAISLFVNLTDEGGTIERFAFGYPTGPYLVPFDRLSDLLDLSIGVGATAEAVTIDGSSPGEVATADGEIPVGAGQDENGVGVGVMAEEVETAPAVG